MVEQDDDLPTNIGQPARRALIQARYRRLDQLSGLSEAELKQLHGVGPKAIDRLRQALAAKGLSFAERSRQTKGA